MTEATTGSFAHLARIREAGQRGDIEYLVDALSDHDKDVRQTAARRLGLTRNPAAVAPLCRLLVAGDQALRVIAIIGLERIGDPAVAPELYDVATEMDAPIGVRVNAMAALGALGDRRAVPLLATVVGDRSLDQVPGLPRRDARSYRRFAADRLVAIGGVEAIPSLLAAKRGAGLRERLAFSRAVKALRDQ